jgi:hypothetical protein
VNDRTEQLPPREAAARLRAIDRELIDLELEILERHMRQPGWWIPGAWPGADHTACAELHRRAGLLWLERARVRVFRCLAAPVPAFPSSGRRDTPSRGPGAGASS